MIEDISLTIKGRSMLPPFLIKINARTSSGDYGPQTMILPPMASCLSEPQPTAMCWPSGLKATVLRST